MGPTTEPHASRGSAAPLQAAGRVSFHPAICLKSALFAKILLLCWSLFPRIEGIACVCAIPSGYHTPKLSRLRGAGKQGMMDCAPESSLMVWFCQESGQKSNLLVPSGGARIDFVSLRAELLRTKEHFIYFPQKSIIYSFYFSDCENSPFSQACVRSAQPRQRQIRRDRCFSLVPACSWRGTRMGTPDVSLQMWFYSRAHVKLLNSKFNLQLGKLSLGTGLRRAGVHRVNVTACGLPA